MPFNTAHPDKLEEIAEAKRRQREAQRQAREARKVVNAGIHAACTHCDAEILVPRKFMGKKIRCPHCGVQLDVPGADLLKPPPEPGEPTMPVSDQVKALVFLVILIFLTCAGFKFVAGFAAK